MRGFHPASSVPRRRRFRRRYSENERTIVAAVRTFHALRRTPSPPVTSPCGLSRCAHFQPTTNPAFSHDEAPGGLRLCSLPTHDEPCRVPLRSPSRPLHICSLSTPYVRATLLRAATRARFACATRDVGMEPGWAQNGRRPQRDGLSLPFSATKVLHTFAQ